MQTVYIVLTNGGLIRGVHDSREGAEKWIADDLEKYGHRNDSAYHWIAPFTLQGSE